MKKLLVMLFAMSFALFCLAGCSGGGNEPASSGNEPPEVDVIPARDKYDTAAARLGLDGSEWNPIGDDYMAWLGFDGSEYADYAGAFKSGSVDVILLVYPADGQAEAVSTILHKQLDTLVGQNENYPGISKDKVDAGRVYGTPDGFLALCIYGDDAVVESDGAEAALQPLLDSLDTVG